ncbi:translation initiation factor IF-3 [Candidatus Peregrinibacteria bacterium]|nr:translation initiation factor IF-3 [Candidatus Peregrinibacteria bacterium]
MSKHLRVNDKIRAPQVLLIDGEEKVGVIPTEEAITRAQEKGLDLVEVSPLADPPVCKVMDFKNYLYNEKKKGKKQKRAQKQIETKTIRLSIRTDIHDLEVKAKKARKFLEGRNIVKVVVLFRGREMAHGDLGFVKMKQFYEMLQDIANIEQEAKRQGYQMTMILNPK